MKRSRVVYTVKDEKAAYLKGVIAEVGEIERYEESSVPKEVDALAEYSFDELLEAGKEMVNGLWNVGHATFRLLKWSVVVIFSGIRTLWKYGVGKEKERKERRKKSP